MARYVDGQGGSGWRGLRDGLDDQRLGYSGDDLGRLDICNLMMKEAAN
jgi:hypothetical protein